MLTKRIIPCLDIANGQTVKGINFVGIKAVGDPVELGKKYADEGADELVFLDISATLDKRKTVVDLVKRIAKNINIPFTIGGGISSIEDVSACLNAGADKVSINSAAVRRPELINELSAEFGSQCITVAIDTRLFEGTDFVHTHGGTKPTDILTKPWAKEVEERGAGEILLTSMDHDGVKTGFANEILASISEAASIPVIASGGAGAMEHFVDTFTLGKADAALAASIFHFKEIGIQELKTYLNTKGVPVRL